MPKLIINDIELEVDDGVTVLQACESAGFEIPRFCYHERLSIAGNCRMCLVEVKGAPKPQASCALSVNDLRPGPDGEPPRIFTNSDQVRQARRGVMEFLLINHPLDCPICDQGGECDLQDQAVAYGVDAGRFAENKRAVEDKYIGPLVKTVMSRCIQCTRCVRFTTEVAGVEELGAIGRGEDMEITTYLQAAMSSELQGNVIDLCPVGALTSAPYEFKARPWELSHTETIDVMDGLGSNIRVDSRGREVLRILPRLHEGINEEWISDKTRFVWDGLRSQRLDRPYIRREGKLVPADWPEALAFAAERLQAASPERIAVLIGDLCAVEDMFALKILAEELGVKHIDCRPPGSPLGEAGGRAGHLFNATIAGIEDADAVLLIGADPRAEAALLNSRLLRRQRAGSLQVGVIGKRMDTGYPYSFIGDGPSDLEGLLDPKAAFARVMKGAKRPAIVIGEGALERGDGLAVLARAAQLAKKCGAVTDDWNGFCVLHRAAARVGGLEIGAFPSRESGALDTAGILQAAQEGDIDVVFLLGADEFDMDTLGNSFVIYQGSHGDAGAHRADVILPGAAYTEKSGLYVNTEGRPQMAARAVFPPGEAREDWRIISALAERLGKPLPFSDLPQLRAALYERVPHLAELDKITPADNAGLDALAKCGGKISSEPFNVAVSDFYLTNPVTRASRVMAQCSALRRQLREKAQDAQKKVNCQ